ncbi:carbohydrate-binding module family 1 protein [Karstenula rhodostoma CBS 690.94]|uniref:AA9 family lytic polysaccharide monooxygenase n=1 Tax=Karstenula rhodostoma CBS 690.94 TaxID=1392251 RepID=A0A9P4UJ03_9PLEO|nr:carbohydrate-binding module family 1 protein [Karstenula rhodostoma CBS 690.94]
MFSKTILVSSLIAAVSAHQNFHQFWVNDETPGYQVGIRMPPSNSPVTDVKSEDIACNVNGQTGVADTVAASEGDSIKVQWDQSGHPGPITHMLFGPVDSAKAATGVGSWFKIDELDNVDGKWANEIMGANNMTHEFKLPTGLPSGEYLLRSEMLALHGAQTVGGAQFYVGCAQLKITGTGSDGACGPTIELPGAYNEEDPNIYIPNVYNGFDATNYTAPGGPVGSCGGSGSTTPSPSKPASNSTTPATSAAVASSVVATTASLASSVAVSSVAAISSAPVVSAPVASVTAVSGGNNTASAPVASVTAAPGGNNTASALPSLVFPSTLQTSVIAAPSTFQTSVIAAPTNGTAPSAPGSTGTVGTVKKYGQCGGKTYVGATSCVTGSTCTVMNDYYSQCI